jgi:ABC-type nitrate/sulfonate/bicarbonate transport system permease component
VFVGVLVLWEVLVRATEVRAFILPPPTAIGAALVDNWGAGRWPLFESARATLFEAMGGLLIGTVIGVVVAFAVSRWANARDAVLPFAIAANAIPIIAIAPIFNAWFGVTNPFSKMMIAALLVFFPVMINVTRGLTAVEPSAIELMQNLGVEGRARSVVIAAPADTSPLMRLQGAAYATTVAEYFRDQGKQVLLIMDSLTRYAMAQREIALAIGEPPVTRGYPPSVFARLPALVERAGNGLEGSGSITAFYTVLAEGDDQQDPIADAARAILDGHIVLSRALADQGHYPAIDVEQSISRAMHSLVSTEHFDLVRRFKQLFSRYQRSRDLIAVGAYQSGADPLLDKAVAMYPRLEAFLQQRIDEQETHPQANAHLAKLFAAG